MPNSDTLALNNNGTLKDTTELEWLNSPSDESHPIFLTNHKKCKRSDCSTQLTSDSKDNSLPVSKNNSPVRRVSGKRLSKLSYRPGASVAFETPKSHKFFQSQFNRVLHL